MTQPKLSGNQIDGGWQLLGEDVVTSPDKFLDFPDIFSDTYNRYKIEIHNLNATGVGTGVQMYFQETGSVQVTGAVAYGSDHRAFGTTTVSQPSASAGDYIPITLPNISASGTEIQQISGKIIINRRPIAATILVGTYYGASLTHFTTLGFRIVNNSSPQQEITGIRFADNAGGESFSNTLGVGSHIIVYGK